MEVVLIGEEKSEDINILKNAFVSKGFDAAPFVRISKVGLFTKGNKTKIVVGTINFRKYDAVFLKAGPQFTPFVEPFLDELVEEGIYCQVKPESYYITANKSMMYSVLNGKGVEIQKTIIVSSPNLLETILGKIDFPLLVKTFVGHKKTQDIIVDSERALTSFANSIKTRVDAITVQEYLEGDLDYCFVVGKEVYVVMRKWDERKLSHGGKGHATTLSENDSKMAFKAALVCGTDIATVKMINGKVINVSPIIDLLRFNKYLGKELENKIAEHYYEMISK